MARLHSPRRSEEQPTPEQEHDDRSGGRGSKASSEYSAKVEKAAERAADATRTAAAAAAADRARARPRTSALASLGLVLAVVAALAVATGTLAALGVAVGGLALLVAIAGLAVTGRRHRNLAGRNEAAVALLLALASIVIGVLAVTDTLSWLDTETDQVARLHDWLPSWLT